MQPGVTVHGPPREELLLAVHVVHIVSPPNDIAACVGIVSCEVSSKDSRPFKAVFGYGPPAMLPS